MSTRERSKCYITGACQGITEFHCKMKCQVLRARLYTWQRLICYGEAKALVFDSLGVIFVNLLLSMSTMYFYPT